MVVKRNITLDYVAHILLMPFQVYSQSATCRTRYTCALRLCQSKSVTRYIESNLLFQLNRLIKLVSSSFSPVPHRQSHRIETVDFHYWTSPNFHVPRFTRVSYCVCHALITLIIKVECNNFTAISTAPFIISPGHRFTNTSEFIPYCSI